MYDKNPIIKKTTIPFKELKSLRVPYAGNCVPDHEKLNVKGNCNCDCDCDCHCDCYYSQDCACDCEQSFCDCNCVCDCGGWVKEGVLLIPEGTKTIFPGTYKDRMEIREVILPAGLEIIEYQAFDGCKNLRKIEFPEGLLKIKASAFRGCPLTEVVLPDSLTVLECNFCSCKSLKRVHIGKGLKEISSLAFHECGIAAFEVDEENPYFKAVDGVLLSKDGKTLHAYPPAKTDKEYTLPEGVVTIGEYAFSHTKGLTTVVLPDGVRYIKSYAFYEVGITKMSVPKSLSYLGDYSLFFAKKLKRIDFRGKKSEFQVRTDSSWAFPHHDYAYYGTDRTMIYTEDGCGWSV